MPLLLKRPVTGAKGVALQEGFHCNSRFRRVSDKLSINVGLLDSHGFIIKPEETGYLWDSRIGQQSEPKLLIGRKIQTTNNAFVKLNNFHS